MDENRCETDLDSLNTVDRLVPPVYANSSGYQQHRPGDFDGYDDGTTVDISEADERMKRYYGIVPKQPVLQQQPHHTTPAFSDKDKEIRTVRIVKRESEKRQRDKTKRSPYDDISYGPEDVEEDEAQHCNDGLVQSGDPIMDDPVLSQFSHVLTLPKRNGGGKRSPSQRNSISEIADNSRTQPLASDQWRNSLRPRRSLSSVCHNLPSVHVSICGKLRRMGDQALTRFFL